MPFQPLQLKRGTALAVSTYTGAMGEPLYATDTHQLFIGDGVTPGGNLVSAAGTEGYTGSQGYTGSAGPQGSTGYTGSASTVQGDIGYTGSAGSSGSNGEQGYTGSRGSVNSDQDLFTTSSVVFATVNEVNIGTGPAGKDTNTILGKGALPNTSTTYSGDFNTAIGYEALKTVGSLGVGGAQTLTGLGYRSLASLNSGERNVALGAYSMLNKDAVAFNVAVGNETLMASGGVGQTYNTAIGDSALKNVSTGVRNIGIGYSAGSNITTGGNNFIVGLPATSTLSNTILMGYGSTEQLKVDSTGLYINGSQIISGIGYTGSKGDQGYTGSQGSQGTTGYTGSKGNAGSDGDRYHTTSNSSLTITNSGNVTLTTADLNLDYSVAQSVIIAYDISNKMIGEVVSYNQSTGSLVIAVNFSEGSGTYSSWNVNLEGAVGALGYTGSQGIQGDSGYTGSKGDTGPQGPQGPQGNIGYTGSQGIQGDQGIQGNTGNTGYTGSKGDTGATGSQGDIGFTGSVGATGPTGYTGSQGIGYEGITSNTSITIGTGSRTFTLNKDSSLTALIPGQRIMIVSTENVNHWMQADITSLSGTTMVANVTVYPSVQTYASWNISVTGLRGVQGPQGFAGSVGAQGITGYTGSQGDLGPQGPKGDTGNDGPQGPLGYTGSRGNDGSQGATGFTGSTGAQGPQGIQGDQGLQGITGYTGSAGQTGAIGNTGSTGYTGSKGDQGTIGIAGYTGSVGATGPQGPQGDQGAAGYTGSAGTNGSNGATGFTGSVGAQGATGPQGPQGDIGYTGSAGTNGTNGYTGSAGTNGTNGATGYTGSTGATGATGPQGPQGNIGDTGYTGSAGTNGATGFTGSKGDTGSTGATGYTGSVGIGYNDLTSNSSITIDYGSKTFTVNLSTSQTSFQAGQRVRVIDTAGAAGYMEGTITSYSSNSLTVYVDVLAGAGVTSSGWGFAAAGLPGVTGPQGPRGYTGSVGASGGTGYTGSKGDTGPQGPQGATGYTGSKGDTGSTGPTGPVAGSANQVVYKDGSNNAAGSADFTFDGSLLTAPLGKFSNSQGDEGGEILLAKPATNSTIAGTGVTIDVYQNKLRIFEQGGSARGAYIDITAMGAGVATNIGAGGTGYTGSAGATGSTGATGYTGSAGSDGATGYTGSAGSAGATGYTGSAAPTAMPINTQTVDYTTVLADAGKIIYYNVTGKTVTIPANSVTAYDVGTVITFITGGSTSLTIACNDTMTFANQGLTGSRTLNSSGVATAIKYASTAWIISGAGLS